MRVCTITDWIDILPVEAAAAGRVDPQFIGKRIRAHRLRMGWSLRELAERLDITYQMVQKLESGRTPLALERLLQLAMAFETSPTELLTEFVQSQDSERAFIAEPSQRSPEERQLLAAFNSLDDKGQRKAILDVARAMAYH